MNILILGETGVGKSTWINGFVNFLTHGTLEEAENGKLLTLIPTRFTVCDNSLKQVVVTTGVDDNEVDQVGQSATQECKVYTFAMGEDTIRLIDTPGIGDTRGIEQDKKNFQNILDTLYHHDKIHGICILLKPNNSRLNVMFRFCIKELLTYLHRDASRNILFCFTNSRGTFYRPGDTMPALEKLLSENVEVEIELSQSTVYCYDSEAYRFLAAVNNDPPVKFSEDERKNFASSWDKSVLETRRMLEYIKTLPGHNIKSTLNLNQARELVLKLARPLAEITRNIQLNKSIVEDERKLLQQTNACIKDLRQQQMTTRTFIEVRRIDYPKTVCTNMNCVKVWNVNDSTTTMTTEYVTVCHDHCQLQNVKEDTVGDEKLMKCWAMKPDRMYCRRPNCGHHYREHMHIYYNSVQVPKLVKDQSFAESLRQKLTAAEVKEQMILTKTLEISEYSSELEKIEHASVRFAYFLKSNAIMPYNDALEQYLKHLIKEEEEKVNRGGSVSTLVGLQQNLESYQIQKEILEKEMVKGLCEEGQSNHLNLGPAEVEQLVKELQDLKHSGKTLREVLQCVEHARKGQYRESVVHPPAGLSRIRGYHSSGGINLVRRFGSWTISLFR